MQYIIDILHMLLRVASYFVFAHVIMSWLIQFNVLNIHQSLVSQIWRGLNQILHPVYSRIRKFLPQMGGLDLTPLIVLLLIQVIMIILPQPTLN